MEKATRLSDLVALLVYMEIKKGKKELRKSKDIQTEEFNALPPPKNRRPANSSEKR